MKKPYFLLIAFFAIVYTSCSKLEDPDQPPVAKDPLTNITLQDTLSMYTGNDIQLHFTTTPANYDLSKLVWESSDTTVISVKNTGEIIAGNEGVAKVTVSNEAKTQSVSCTIAVKDSLSVGLIAYYPFNNSAADSSGHNHNGVAYDLTSIADRFGKANSAYEFNGVSSYVVVPDKPALRLSGTDFTLNYWVNLDHYGQSYGTVILSKRGLGNTNGWITGVGGYLNAYSIVGKYGTVTYNVSGGDNPFAYGQIITGLNAWHMLTVVYKNSSQQASIYVDGVFDRSTENIPTPNAATSADMYIGADSQGTSNSSFSDYLVRGGVDDIRIYKRALTSTEVHKLFVAIK